MALRTNITIQAINDVLDREGIVSFLVLRDSGSQLAQITLEGNHRIELRALVYHRNREERFGRAEIYRKSGEAVDEAMLWSAFGTAYARAVDADRSVAPLLKNDVERLVDGVRRGYLGTVEGVLAKATGHKVGTLGELARSLIDAAREPLPTGPIEVGDFVVVEDNGHAYRGLVRDALVSRTSGDAVSFLLVTADGEEAVLAKNVTLIAKGN